MFHNLYTKYLELDYLLLYIHFHFDEKWNKIKHSDYVKSLKIIDKLSEKYKVIITTGIKNFNFFKDLHEKFYTVNFVKNKFVFDDVNNKNNIILLKNLPLNLLAYFIKNSQINYSFHSGPIIHISPTFDRQIVDIIPKFKNEELDRWIPTVSKYKRINFEDLNDEIIENI